LIFNPATLSVFDHRHSCLTDLSVDRSQAKRHFVRWYYLEIIGLKVRLFFSPEGAGG